MSEKELAMQAYEIQTDLAVKYGVDLASRIIQVVGEIDEDSFVRFDTALTLLEAGSKQTVTVKINSLGGSVYDALAIVGRIRNSKCQIITEAYGACMSASLLILACGKKRRMSSFAWAMHHEMSYELAGTHEQIKLAVAQAEREGTVWNTAMFALTNCDIWETVGKQGNDYYLTPKQCKEHGVIDEIF